VGGNKRQSGGNQRTPGHIFLWKTRRDGGKTFLSDLKLAEVKGGGREKGKRKTSTNKKYPEKVRGRGDMEATGRLFRN